MGVPPRIPRTPDYRRKTGVTRLPIWSEILSELAETQEQGGHIDFDGVRRKYLAELHTRAGTDVILYASGWLQKNEAPQLWFR